MDKTILSFKHLAHSNGLKESTMIKLNNSGIFFILFRNTLFSVWKVNDKTVGYRKQVGLYELRTVNNAGHLVPMDQGPAARQLVKDFVAGKSVETQAQEKVQNMNVVSN